MEYNLLGIALTEKGMFTILFNISSFCTNLWVGSLSVFTLNAICILLWLVSWTSVLPLELIRLLLLFTYFYSFLHSAMCEDIVRFVLPSDSKFQIGGYKLWSRV